MTQVFAQACQACPNPACPAPWKPAWLAWSVGSPINCTSIHHALSRTNRHRHLQPSPAVQPVGRSWRAHWGGRTRRVQGRVLSCPGLSCRVHLHFCTLLHAAARKIATRPVCRGLSVTIWDCLTPVNPSIPMGRWADATTRALAAFGALQGIDRYCMGVCFLARTLQFQQRASQTPCYRCTCRWATRRAFVTNPDRKQHARKGATEQASSTDEKGSIGELRRATLRLAKRGCNRRRLQVPHCRQVTACNPPRKTVEKVCDALVGGRHTPDPCQIGYQPKGGINPSRPLRGLAAGASRFVEWMVAGGRLDAFCGRRIGGPVPLNPRRPSAAWGGGTGISPAPARRAPTASTTNHRSPRPPAASASDGGHGLEVDSPNNKKRLSKK